MNTSLVPTLQHLACSRSIASLLNHPEVQKNFPYGKMITSQVKDAVSRLTSSTQLQDKLEEFIDPLLREIDDCLNFFKETAYGFRDVSGAVWEIIPQCWLSDGTIHREKVARFLVKNKKSDQINRFIFACTFCLFSDAVEVWNALFPIERAFLKNNSTEVVKLWIEWFESSSTNDWESFLAWSLGTPLWHSNVSILRHTLQKISPAERSHYLLSTLIGKEVDDDVMRFCLSVMTQDEQAQILREETVQVFSCMISWPLRHIFFDMADKLWPYFTERSFCKAIRLILRKIQKLEREDVELLMILENFWQESPEHFKNAAKDEIELFFLPKSVVESVRRCLESRGLPLGFWEVFSSLGTTVWNIDPEQSLLLERQLGSSFMPIYDATFFD